MANTVIFSGEAATADRYAVLRLNDGQPIITEDSFAAAGASDKEGRNINGPAVMRVPQWLKDSGQVADPNANYYLYFSHHHGDYIRMAWAENIEGPWTLYRTGAGAPIGQRGVLDLGEDDEIHVADGFVIEGHIASPYPVVDEENQRIILFFHGAMSGQKTFAATSADGLNFNMPAEGGQAGHGVRESKIAGFYFYPFTHRGTSYAFTNMGHLWRAPGGGEVTDEQSIAPYSGYRLWDRTEGPIRTTHDGTLDDDGDPPEEKDNPRHFGLRFSSHNSDELHVFFTRRDDAPERIIMQTVDLTQNDDWEQWTEASWPPEDILAPELDWEGADLPITPSKNGSASGVRQLRDPHVFEDIDGRIYLFYTGRGEEAIGIAELFEQG